MDTQVGVRGQVQDDSADGLFLSVLIQNILANFSASEHV